MPSPRTSQQPVVLDWDIAHPMMQYIRDLSLIFIATAKIVELPAGRQEPDRQQPGVAGLHRPPRGVHRRGRHVPADRRDHAEHDLVPLYQLPAVRLEQHPGAGQRPRGCRRRGGRARRAGRRCTPRRSARRSRSTRPERRDGETIATLAPGDVHLQSADKTGVYLARWENNGRLPFAVNLFDVRESDLAPRGLVPEGVPAALAESVQDQDRLQPRHRHPEAHGRPARTSGGTSPCSSSACCSSSGMSTTGGCLFEGMQINLAATRSGRTCSQPIVPNQAASNPPWLTNRWRSTLGEPSQPLGSTADQPRRPSRHRGAAWALWCNRSAGRNVRGRTRIDQGLQFEPAIRVAGFQGNRDDR